MSLRHWASPGVFPCVHQGTRLGTKGKVRRRAEWKGRQKRGRPGPWLPQRPTQHTAHGTRHTAGQTAYRRAWPIAPCRAPPAWCPCPASAGGILLFQRRQGLTDWEGSPGPGAGAAGLGHPAPAVPALSSSSPFLTDFSKLSEGRGTPHCRDEDTEEQKPEVWEGVSNSGTTGG